MSQAGRARGRPRTKQSVDSGNETDVRTPGQADVSNSAPLIGRGRSRGRPRNQSVECLTAEINAFSLSDKRNQMFDNRAQVYERFSEQPIITNSNPKSGQTGSKVLLSCNYFKLNMELTHKIYQYHVLFTPEIENVRVKFMLIHSLSNIIGEDKIFDGGVLYLHRLLDTDPKECQAKRDGDGTIIKMRFKLITEVTENHPQFLHVANLMFKKALMALDMKRIRDHFFNMKLEVKIPAHKILVIPGFLESILKYDAGNLLGLDTIHKVIRMDTYLDALRDIFKACRENREAFRRRATKELVGVIVLTKYNNKTYRIDDINWDAAATDTFSKNGEQISFVDYYLKAWNIKIQDENQPLLVSRPTERDVRRGDKSNLYLLPELCIITGISNEMRADFNVMRDLAVHTRINPTERLKQIQKFMQQLVMSKDVDAMLKPWNINFTTEPLKIEGRQLPPEHLVVKDRYNQQTQISYDPKEADWSRSMKSVSLLNPVAMGNWLLLYPQQEESLALSLGQSLMKVGQNIGMAIEHPKRVEVREERNDSYLTAIRQCLTKETQMVVCVVPNQKKDRYDAIKKCCCLENPVPSQVVTCKTLRKKDALFSVATKIAIQMNCKMGGEVWGAEIPLKGLMVVGIDTYKDSSHRNQSVGALVASLNKQCTRFFSKTEYHPSKDELMRNLHPLMQAALRKFYEVNQSLPVKIILYRDGVGDGQLKEVFTSEYEQLTRAVRDAGGIDYKPGVAFLVVKKRIMSRFFASIGNAWGNPNPGTIVDQCVTKPNWYDFFLVSQSVRQGTVTPTNYHVIFDDTGLTPDHMQRLSYKLTHLYFNWQIHISNNAKLLEDKDALAAYFSNFTKALQRKGTIRVPAPCQYAHKLAVLQGQSLHREFDASLSDKLFYL